LGFPEFDVKVATIRCEPSGREVRVVHDSNLMDAILQTGLGLGQSCDGIDNLTPAESEERKVLAAQHAGEDERLACCARINGPVTLKTGYW